MWLIILEYYYYTVMDNYEYFMLINQDVPGSGHKSAKLGQSLGWENLLGFRCFDLVQITSYRPSLATCTVIMGQKEAIYYVKKKSPPPKTPKQPKITKPTTT